MGNYFTSKFFGKNEEKFNKDMMFAYMLFNNFGILDINNLNDFFNKMTEFGFKDKKLTDKIRDLKKLNINSNYNYNFIQEDLFFILR